MLLKGLFLVTLIFKSLLKNFVLFDHLNGIIKFKGSNKIF
jgi:hypothetical protein